MRHVVIYYSDGSKQVVRPSEKFNGDWAGLVANITQSNDDHKNYLHYEIF